MSSSGVYMGGSTRERRKKGASAASARPLHADIDPPPRSWPFAPALAFLGILLFLSLQLVLPVTHVRHPQDPFRSWIPVSQLNKNKNLGPHNIRENSEEGRNSMVVVMDKQADIRPVFVVINSTISNTREAEKLQFLAILPSNISRSQSMKLRAIFSNLNLHIEGYEFMIDKMRPFVSEITNNKDLSLMGLIPFYLPKMFPLVERFVYMESDVVLQGDIEELIKMNMEGHPIAAVEDCSQTFRMYFDFGLLEASRLSSEIGKPLMPSHSYDLNTCLLDRGILVLDGKAWAEEKILEAAHWWTGMHHKTGESLYSNGHLELPMHLAIYNGYKKVDSSWGVREPLTWAKVSHAKLVHFDNYHKPWHQMEATEFEKNIASLWWKYLSPSTNTMFNS